MHQLCKAWLATLALSALAPAVQASQLATFTFSGTIEEVEIGNPALAFALGYDPTNLPAATALLAPFAAGQAFNAEVVVDLDSPRTPNDGVASFAGSIQRFHFSVPDANWNSVSIGSTHQGVSITANDDGNGDVYYFYLPKDYMAKGTYMTGSFYAIRPDANLSAEPNLYELATSFYDPSTFDPAPRGTISVLSSDCGGPLLDRCGSLELNITSTSVTAVPEASTWSMMSLGLAGFCLLALRRHQGDRTTSMH